VSPPPDQNNSRSNRGAASGARRFLSRRTLWHTAGLLIALALAWLILRGYRQPEFLLDFVNMRLC
jgi:hypothetical protein